MVLSNHSRQPCRSSRHHFFLETCRIGKRNTDFLPLVTLILFNKLYNCIGRRVAMKAMNEKMLKLITLQVNDPHSFLLRWCCNSVKISIHRSICLY